MVFLFGRFPFLARFNLKSRLSLGLRRRMEHGMVPDSHILEYLSPEV